MEKGPKRLLYMALGLLDYLRDQWEELQDELVRRGEERAEDINDFWGDVIENMSGAAGAEKVPEEAGDDEAGDGDRPGLGSLLADVDVKGVVSDLLDDIGLADRGDLEEISEQLDRIGRAIENL